MGMRKEQLATTTNGHAGVVLRKADKCISRSRSQPTVQNAQARLRNMLRLCMAAATPVPGQPRTAGRVHEPCRGCMSNRHGPFGSRQASLPRGMPPLGSPPPPPPPPCPSRSAGSATAGSPPRSTRPCCRGAGQVVGWLHQREGCQCWGLHSATEGTLLGFLKHSRAETLGNVQLPCHCTRAYRGRGAR